MRCCARKSAASASSARLPARFNARSRIFCRVYRPGGIVGTGDVLLYRGRVGQAELSAELRDRVRVHLALPLLEVRPGLQDGGVVGVQPIDGGGPRGGERGLELLRRPRRKGNRYVLALARHLDELAGKRRRAASTRCGAFCHHARWMARARSASGESRSIVPWSLRRSSMRCASTMRAQWTCQRMVRAVHSHSSLSPTYTFSLMRTN